MMTNRAGLVSREGELRFAFHARRIFELAEKLAEAGAPPEMVEALWAASGWLSAARLWLREKREEARRRERDAEGVDRG